MNKTLIGLILCFVMGLTQLTLADTTSNGATTNTQTTTSGSNTTISGGYSQESTTTYASGSSSNTTSTTTTNAYTGDQRVVNSSSAPSMSAMSQDLCVVGMSGGMSSFGLGISAGTYRTDENCERIKLSKVLNDLGMKVAAVSILCQDPRVFFAMEQSGTPCPFEGKIGKAATEQWSKYNKLRPDYEIYTKRLKVVQKADKIQAKKDEIARQEELKKVQEKLKKIEEEKSNKEWKEVDKAADIELKKKSLEMKKNPPK
jgi:hypothetical protein